MVDYFKVEPDVVRLMNKHFTRGRGGQKIQFIVRHHNAGITTTEQTWQTWQSRQASAHYQVETSGRVGQLVWDRDTAWANANTLANQRGIAIEHSNNGGAAQDWPIADATIVAGAKWAAALCHFYKLGRPHFGTNIRDHRQFGATACPYHLASGGKYHARWMQAAQAHYDWMTANQPGATPAPAAPNAIDAEAEIAKAWIGEPLHPEERDAKDGGRYRDFENGSIYWHPDVAGGKAIAVPTWIYETWKSHDWERGFLGYPTMRHTVIDGVGDIQAFQGGIIYRRYGHPGYPVRGVIGKRWKAEGYEAGVLGWPTSDEYDVDGGKRQDFQNGHLEWHPSGAVKVVKA